MRDTLEENVMVSKLIEKIQKTKAPICVGLDPMLGYIPNHIVQRAFKDFGETMEGAAEAVWQFNKEIIDNTYDLIPSVKPQIAMYEQFGIEGLKIYARTIEYCQNKGLLVIGDVKRGDIGSTSSAYAVGHIGSVKVGSNVCRGFNTDFITVNPYLGTDGIKPFVNVCNDEDRGLFVLVKTSNPSSGEFQDRLVDGRPLYELVAEKVVEWGEASMDGDYSNVGAVVGARKAQVRLAELAPVKVDFIERYDQSVLAVVRKLADHSPDAVLVVEFADFVLFEHVPASGSRLHGRRFRDSRSGRSGWNSRSGRSGWSGRGQRRRGNGFGVILLFAVGILDVMDLRNGEHVGRTVGIRKTLVTHRFGRDFDHFGFDFRGVGLDDQVLRGGRQGAAQRCERQQNGSFHHYQYRYIRQI